MSNGYDRLPTFGVGADLNSAEWHAYILQMIQLGMIEVAYEENFHLRATPLGLKVLRGEEKGVLARYEIPTYYVSDQRRMSKRKKTQADQLSPDEALLRALKELRVTLAAQKKGMADYMVLSDVTITQIVEQKPMDVTALARIEGMGMARLAEYYSPVLAEVCKHVKGVRRIPRGQSDLLSRTMYEHGMSVGEIAAMRHLKPATVLMHLLGFVGDGFDFDCSSLLSADRFVEVGRMADEYLRRQAELPSRQEGEMSESLEERAARMAVLAELRARLLEEYGVTEEEYVYYRSIEHVYSVENGRYVIKPVEVAEPLSSYGDSTLEDSEDEHDEPSIPSEDDPYDSEFDPDDPDDGLI